MRENFRERTLKLGRKFSWRGGQKVSERRETAFIVITQKYTTQMMKNFFRNVNTFRADAKLISKLSRSIVS